MSAEQQNLSAALAAYADRLLLSTALDADQVLQILRHELEITEAPAEIVRPLRAGWSSAPEAAA
jgi:hypothetical protein